MANIGYHASHNGAFIVEEDGKILCVIEVERFLNAKNMGLCAYLVPRLIMGTIEEILSWIEKEYGISEYENCYYSNADFVGENFEGKHISFNTLKLIKAKKYYHVGHHEAHAYGGFYQSQYKEALIFSFDGGGDDGDFNIYHGKRDEGITLLKRILSPAYDNPHICYNLGFPYMIFGQYCSDIKEEWIATGNLVWPGKLMGLASYGKVIDEWVEHFIEFYKSDPDGKDNDYIPKLDLLGEKIGVNFSISERLTGQIEYDVVATSQRAFEECFLEVVKPYMDEYPELPICVVGGCALNIILNTRLINEYKKQVFVGPNPNDCGIAAGCLIKYLKPQEQLDLTYSGIPILDKNILLQRLCGYPNVRKLMPKDSYYHPYEQWEPSIISKDLAEGKIVGVVMGNSEHGPRALGHRSILCNPSIPEMKDTLNHKVKHREWYRPFAPVVRLEDVEKYFEFSGEARWMSFCPIVKEEWRIKLQAITHVDNTARIQTITKDQNEWLYNLLGEIEELTGVGVLLNTSFNVNGKPILSTYSDAFEIYDNSELDCLLLEDYYLRKLPFTK